MGNEELIGQRRYLSPTGAPPLTCERCGLPVERANAIVVDGSTGIAEPVEGIILCQSCLTLIQKGLEPVELAGEDEE